VAGAERLLVKVPEHTWGVSQAWFLPDNENWTNVQFDAARAQQQLGFVRDNARHADYNSTVGSWIEQVGRSAPSRRRARPSRAIVRWWRAPEWWFRCLCI
jgi:hypothetical protein